MDKNDSSISGGERLIEAFNQKGDVPDWQSCKEKSYSLRRLRMINFIVWLIVGGIIGWIASMIMGTDHRQGPLLNIIVGIVGAFLGGLLLTPLLGVGTINQNVFSLPGLLVSLLGAIILLAIVNLFTRGRPVR
jgi:uncharacterized membrane protein YeaQ/YmgE (transglycosylase-associated protein family)